MVLDGSVCVTPSCGKPATLRCPTCLKLGILNSFFCTQECFKNTWKTHKIIHLVSTGDSVTRDERFAGYSFSGSLRPSEKTPKRSLPTSIMRPDYTVTGIPQSEREAKGSHTIVALNDEEIEGMRLAGRFGREVLEEAVNAVRVGVTTDELDQIVHEACIERDCYPSPLNYYEFPKSCCTSINEVICHGIPDKRPLEDGDILNLDITTYHRGFHGDVNETVFVGRPDDRSIRLVRCAYNCLARSMDAVQTGVKYRDIGAVISKEAAAFDYSVVRTYSGHGIHRLFHCPPNVPHYSRNKAVGIMRPRHCFTIEPMINEGTWRDQLWPDGWTAVTEDGKRSAQFEHTMLLLEPAAVTNGIPIEVMTKRRIHGEDPVRLDLLSLGGGASDDDSRHFERYGRPYFVDQLHQLGMLDRLSTVKGK